MGKLTKEIYASPTVQDAIRNADSQRDRSIRDGDDDHFTVWVDPPTKRVFVRRQENPMYDRAEPVYDSEEGRYIE